MQATVVQVVGGCRASRSRRTALHRNLLLASNSNLIGYWIRTFARRLIIFFIDDAHPMLLLPIFVLVDSGVRVRKLGRGPRPRIGVTCLHFFTFA